MRFGIPRPPEPRRQGARTQAVFLCEKEDRKPPLRSHAVSRASEMSDRIRCSTPSMSPPTTGRLSSSASRKNLKVGNESTWWSPISCGVISASSRANVTPANSGLSESAAKSGLTAAHGPHHGAPKSATSNPPPGAISKSYHASALSTATTRPSPAPPPAAASASLRSSASWAVSASTAAGPPPRALSTRAAFSPCASSSGTCGARSSAATVSSSGAGSARHAASSAPERRVGQPASRYCAAVSAWRRCAELRRSSIAASAVAGKTNSSAPPPPMLHTPPSHTGCAAARSKPRAASASAAAGRLARPRWKALADERMVRNLALSGSASALSQYRSRSETHRAKAASEPLCRCSPSRAAESAAGGGSSLGGGPASYHGAAASRGDAAAGAAKALSI
mmetsp:Transcript_48184/g.151409  ORF Transcript_48184/g.151409 Transcript_48184/m.151409 type:complete len:395 (-) Transcript_48184:262-1446(-)